MRSFSPGAVATVVPWKSVPVHTSDEYHLNVFAVCVSPRFIQCVRYFPEQHAPSSTLAVACL